MVRMPSYYLEESIYFNECERIPIEMLVCSSEPQSGTRLINTWLLLEDICIPSKYMSNAWYLSRAQFTSYDKVKGKSSLS